MKKALLTIALMCVFATPTHARVSPHWNELEIARAPLSKLYQQQPNDVERMCTRLQWGMLMGKEPTLNVMRFIEYWCGEDFMLYYFSPHSMESNK